MDVAKIEVAAPMEFYISSVNFAQTKSSNFEKWVKFNQIDTIINVSDFQSSDDMRKYYERLGIKRVIYYPFTDDVISESQQEHIVKILTQIYNKLGRKNLVHCTMGINRSALVIAYSLCKCTNFTSTQIIDLIKYYNKRYRTLPALINPSFVEFISKL